MNLQSFPPRPEREHFPQKQGCDWCKHKPSFAYKLCYDWPKQLLRILWLNGLPPCCCSIRFNKRLVLSSPFFLPTLVVLAELIKWRKGQASAKVEVTGKQAVVAAGEQLADHATPW